MSNNPDPLRFSRLKLFQKSAAHFAARTEEESIAMEIGTAADALLLGGQQVLAYPGPVRRGKEYDAFCAANPGALILTQHDAAKALGIAEAVTACPDATWVLTGTKQETLHWTFQGRACRTTPDVRNVDRQFISDLKTGETSDPRFFPFKVQRFAYHAQLAFYRHGCALAGVPVPECCYIVAVEQAPPHVVTVFRLTDHVLELGDRLWRLWFEQLQVAEASGEFPGYAQSVVELDLPDDEAIDLSDAVELVETTA